MLVVILLLTYGVYGFTERMLAERQASNAHARSVQAAAFAASGIEYAASVVTTRAVDPANPVSLYHRPDLLSGVVMQESTSPAAMGRFSLVAPVEGDVTGRQVRFGLSDESGKLNLNAIAAMGLDEYDEPLLLMSLPGMTEDIADAILDFLDEDETTRLFGAESDYYGSIVPPYSAKNGPLDSLDELLLVRGVTPELLYGEDANRNGLLDPSEDDGPASLPFDNGDGVLQPGWQAYLTVYGRESNSRPDGSAKIHINQGLLTDLYDAILEELDDEEVARFIVAFRMYGPNDGDVQSNQPASGVGGATDGEQSGDSSTESDSTEGTREGSSPSDGLTASQARGLDNFAGQLGRVLGGGSAESSITRGGLDLSKGAQFEISSLYDLVDREVDIPADPQKGIQAETIVSPWTSSGLTADFPLLIDTFALTENAFLEGRININEARPEILLGLPGMTPQLADAIVAGRTGPNGEPLAETPDRRTTAWIVEQGLVDLPTMRQLDRFLTGRGDVFQVQSVGFFEGGGPVARLEAIIDGTVTPAKIISHRDLSELGRGYSPSLLHQNTSQFGL